MALGYVITWGVSEGGFVTTVDQELITYAVHDILSKVIVLGLVIYGRENVARYGSW